MPEVYFVTEISRSFSGGEVRLVRMPEDKAKEKHALWVKMNELESVIDESNTELTKLRGNVNKKWTAAEEKRAGELGAAIYQSSRELEELRYKYSRISGTPIMKKGPGREYKVGAILSELKD